MSDNFNERLIVITGASGGIGETVTSRWLGAGASVIAAASSETSLAKLVESVDPADTSRLITVAADLTTAQGASTVFEAASAAFGMTPDTLIHLVGGFAYGDFDTDDGAEVWKRMMALNVTSAVHAFRAALPGMRERGGGWITALAARAAGEPSPKMAAYAGSKAALVSLIRSLSAEVKRDDIHVNVMLTSIVDTPANRAAMGDGATADWVTPTDIADATLYLCSNSARALHGATLEVYAKA